MENNKITAVIAELQAKAAESIQTAVDIRHLPNVEEQTPDEVEFHEVEAAHYAGQGAGLQHAIYVLQLATVAQVWIPPERHVTPDDFLTVTRDELVELLHRWAALEAVEWMRYLTHAGARADRANIAGRISALMSFAELLEAGNIGTPVAGDRLPSTSIDYEDLYRRAVELKG